MFTDWKTTVTGIVTGVVTVLAAFGIVIPAEWIPVIIGIGVLILGFFAKDGKK